MIIFQKMIRFLASRVTIMYKIRLPNFIYDRQWKYLAIIIIVTKDEDWTIQFVVFLIGIFKPIDINKWIIISIIVLVFKNTFDNRITFPIINLFNRHYIALIQMTLDFDILHNLDVRYIFVKITSLINQ